MKVTRLGSTTYPSTTGLAGGGGTVTDSQPPSGQVPTANGSNSWSWGSNVATIWANGSNQIMGPAVNFAAGSNVTFTFDGLVGSQPSNTIRIHATGGSGSGSLTIEDEGTPLATAADTLNFTGAGVTATGSGAEKTITIPGGGGSSVGQVYSYPTSFDGTDTFDGSSTTPFADVDAFTTKEVLNSRILHLQTDGASKDDRVRVTLGTTKSGVFDVRTCLTAHLSRWSTDRDTWLEVRLSASDDTQIAKVRIYGAFTGPNSTAYMPIGAKMGTGDPSAAGTNFDAGVPLTTPVTLRFARDGSNNVTAQIGVGNQPTALGPFFDGGLVPLTASSSATLARVEYAIHTPAGPGATAQAHCYLDYLLNL